MHHYFCQKHGLLIYKNRLFVLSENGLKAKNSLSIVDFKENRSFHGIRWVDWVAWVISAGGRLYV